MNKPARFRLIIRLPDWIVTQHRLF